MSMIFDALQRAEIDRSGIGLPALSAATEVVKLAELHAAVERKGATKPELPRTSVPEPEIVQPPRLGGGAAVAVGPSSSVNTAQLSMFAQFKSIPIQTTPDSHMVCLEDGQNPAAEQFQFLGVRLQHLRRERPLKKVLITSTIPKEGKSMVAANLACALARRTQQKVLLVEGDVRRPTLATIFGIPRIPGLCELLQAEGSLASNIYHLDRPALWLLPAGNAKGNPLQLLQSGRLFTLFDQLGELFDWIVIDSPPVLPVADTSIWMRLADGILLVTRQGTTEKSQLQRGLEAIDQKKVVGAVLNCRRRPARSDYYYGYLAPTEPK
jgi:capsular exopolysaccharide synthesis family protein